jgi:MarR family transcriptional regulator, organic hydroperoxide resistance regulator
LITEKIFILDKFLYLSDVMNLDRSTVTRLISSLEKKNIVKRIRSGRTIAVQLSSKGVDMLPEIQECWMDLYRRYCVEFGKEKAGEVNQLIAGILFGK